MKHTKFQALSACEAIGMERAIGKAIAEAFRGGIRTAFLMSHCNPGPKESVSTIVHYLEKAGIEIDDETALELLVQALASVVREEHKHDK